MPEINITEEGKKLFDVEIAAMEAVKNVLDERFEKIVKLICDCKGKVVITGMGKPGHIGTKIAATMASLGTPSFFLHPAEAQHGDLGMLDKDDVVIAISFSGESEEVTKLIPSLKLIGATLGLAIDVPPLISPQLASKDRDPISKRFPILLFILVHLLLSCKNIFNILPS